MEEGLPEAGLRIELIPTLDRCIETVARQERSRHANELLDKGTREEELERRVELLRLFLESFDFRELRSQSEKHLAEGRAVRFIVRLEEGRPKYEMAVDD